MPTTKRRTTSGAFTQLDPAQVRQLKEAFTLLDKDGNGTISEDDLTEMLVSLGRDPSSSQEVQNMLDLMPQPLTFSSFLTGMSALLGNVSSSSDLLDAFAAFEEHPVGGGHSAAASAGVDSSATTTGGEEHHHHNYRIHVDELREMLLETGMSPQDVDKCFSAFLKPGGLAGDWFYYRDFVSMMKGGNLNDE